MLSTPSVRAQISAGVAMAALAVSVPGFAQTTENADQSRPQASDSGQLNQIVVTARRVEENLQSTPISITALSAEDLREQGATNLAALDRIAPNLTYTTNGGSSMFAGMGSNPGIFMRGIGQTDFVIGSDPGVGTYVDGVFIARSFGGNLENLDIQRVEVLRGPQGTLFGKNTEGGAISMTTTRPGDQFEGRMDVAYGSRNRLDVEGAVTLPLAEGLSARAAFLSRTQDGYIYNDYLDTDVANTNVQAGRLSLRFNPGEGDLDVLLSGEFLSQRQRGQQLSLLGVRLPVDGDPNDMAIRSTFYNRALAPLQGNPLMGPQWIADPRRSNSGTLYDDNANVYGVTLNASYDLGGVQLRSITAYRDVETEFGGDMDFSPANYWENKVETFQEQFSQELQITGSAFDDRLDFTGGLFYFHEKGRDQQVSGFLVDAVTALGLAAPHSIAAPGYDTLQCPNPDPAINATLCLGGNLANAPEAVAAAIALQLANPNHSNRRQVNDTYAAYGQLTWHVNDQLALTGGLRYSDETKNAIYRDITPDGVTPTNPATTNVTGNQKARIWTYTATLGYQATPDLYLYATHSSGYKAGGIVSRVFQGQVRLPAYQPEFNYNYEIGWKADLFDRRLRVNGALFRNWYKDIQFGYFRIIGGLLEAYIANPSDAELFGGELEVTALIGDRLTLNGSIGVTDMTYKNVKPEAPAPLLLGDARPENVPGTKVTGGFTYRQPIGEVGNLSLRMDYSWRSSTVLVDYVQVAPAERIRYVQDPYGIGTARLTYAPVDGDWNVYVHVDNLFDTTVSTSRFNYNGIEAGLFNRPREIRAGVALNF